LACGAKGNRLPRLMKRRPTARIFLAVGFYMPHGSRKSENGREIGIAPVLRAKESRCGDHISRVRHRLFALRAAWISKARSQNFLIKKHFKKREKN